MESDNSNSNRRNRSSYVDTKNSRTSMHISKSRASVTTRAAWALSPNHLPPSGFITVSKDLSPFSHHRCHARKSIEGVAMGQVSVPCTRQLLHTPPPDFSWLDNTVSCFLHPPPHSLSPWLLRQSGAAPPNDFLCSNHCCVVILKGSRIRSGFSRRVLELFFVEATG